MSPKSEILITISDIFSTLTTETDMSAIMPWHHCCNLTTIKDYKVWIWDILDQGWRTYGRQKDFLGTRHSLLSQFFLFLQHDWRLYIVKNMMYVYIYIYTHIHTVCPTRYRTRHFFINSNTNEDIAKKFEQG
jgi:hypothetical protein